MKRFAPALACLLLASTCAMSDEPRRENEKRVFPGAEPLWVQPDQMCLWAARLSPDGRRLLYPRFQGEPPTKDGRQEWDKVKCEMVLRELDTGKDVVLPIEPLDIGWRTVLTRFNPFDASGRRMVLVNVKQERTRVDERGIRVRTKSNLAIYSVTEGKAVDGNSEEGEMLARFDRTGEGLIGVRGGMKTGYEFFTASLPGLAVRALPVKGLANSVCPSGDVVCVWAPPERKPPPAPGQPAQRGTQRLFLYDLKAKKETGDLPVDQRNSRLDDYETQWTPDGNHLYYFDVEDDPGAPAGGGRPATRGLTRVWDRQAHRELTNIPLTLPVGPGPAPSSMVLARFSDKGEEAGFLLHDAARGTLAELGEPSLQLVHAWGSRVLFVRTGADKKRTLFVADMVVSADAKPAN